MAWVDNLRTALIALVVNMHACVTYSHVGDWYLNEPPEPGMAVKIGFMFWQGHLQAFFMGVLFFLAGYFAHQSLRRRGPGPFIRERLLRLGTPALVYMLAIHPFIVFVLLRGAPGADAPPLTALYGQYLASGRFLRCNGPLWFALALLFFSLVLAGWRMLPGRSLPETTTAAQPPGPGRLWMLAVVLVTVTFLTRLVQPLGTNVWNFQLGFFPQYVAAFAIGVRAGTNGWLEGLVTSRHARAAGWLGLLGGPLALAALAWLGGPPPETGDNPYAGGWNAHALGYAAWEQMAGIGLALGMMAFFRRFGNRGGRAMNWFADRAFGVYVFHAPVLVALTLALRPVSGGPFARIVLLTITGLALSYAVAEVARRAPGLPRVT